jgi:hypothetical protein
MTKKKARKSKQKPGPQEKRLIINEDPQSALLKLLKADKPKTKK